MKVSNHKIEESRIGGELIPGAVREVEVPEQCRPERKWWKTEEGGEGK